MELGIIIIIIIIIIIDNFFVHFKHVHVTYQTFIIVASSFASKYSQSSNRFLDSLQ